MSVSRSGFYRWLERKESPRKKTDSELKRIILEIFNGSRCTYGSPRVLQELKNRHGIRISKKRVERLMREESLQGRQKRRFKRTTDSNHKHRISPNVLNRDFTAVRTNEAWVTDVKAIRILEGWLFLAAITDLLSRRIVGWSMSYNNDTELALAALTMALRLRRVGKGLIHHSDRGSPYASVDYREKLKDYGIVQSMSRKGDCWDNAVAESLFSTLEWEHLGRLPVGSGRVTKVQVEEYIRFFNHERIHSTVNFASPVEFELRCNGVTEVA